MFFRTLTFSILFSLSAFGSFSQPRKLAPAEKKTLNDSFIADYRKALGDGFTDKALNGMFRKYDVLLTPHSDVTRFKEALEGNKMAVFPLFRFKSTGLYKASINKLLNSKNSDHRILAYLVIAASGDSTKEDILLEKIRTETNKGNLIWSGMALLYLGSDHTTPLFDFLVKNEDFGDAHMFPLYVRLNKDSLQQTAYNRINSSNPLAKILAAQILSVTPPNTRTDQLLINAVKNWDISIKGYAIYSIKELQIGNLLDSFKPLLDSPQTRRISLEALANSPTDTDRNYVYHLIEAAHDTVPDDLLECLYKSKRIDNLRYWLKLLDSRQISTGYVFFVFDQPLISSNEILADVQTALEKCKQPKIVGELVRALGSRVDDRSIDIMIRLLKNKDSSVRYWTAQTLEGNKAPRLQTKEVQDLITGALKDG